MHCWNSIAGMWPCFSKRVSGVKAACGILSLGEGSRSKALEWRVSANGSHSQTAGCAWIYSHHPRACCRPPPAVLAPHPQWGSLSDRSIQESVPSVQRSKYTLLPRIQRMWQSGMHPFSGLGFVWCQKESHWKLQPLPKYLPWRPWHHETYFLEDQNRWQGRHHALISAQDFMAVDVSGCTHTGHVQENSSSQGTPKNLGVKRKKPCLPHQSCCVLVLLYHARGRCLIAHAHSGCPSWASYNGRRGHKWKGKLIFGHSYRMLNLLYFLGLDIPMSVNGMDHLPQTRTWTPRNMSPCKG